MNVNLYEDGSDLIVELKGDLDHHCATYLRQKIDNYYMMSPIKNIIFNFKDVGFMDSSGIGVIIGRYNKVSKAGGEITIKNPTDHVKKIIDMSGIAGIIKIEN